MAFDINSNGGKFITGIKPPFSDSESYQLSYEWGSRIAVISGRMMGLHGYGTVESAGTTISFPNGYFTDTPLFEGCYLKQNISLYGTVVGSAFTKCQTSGDSISWGITFNGTSSLTLTNNYGTSIVLSWLIRGL
jgi:hypothetical protein